MTRSTPLRRFIPCTVLFLLSAACGDAADDTAETTAATTTTESTDATEDGAPVALGISNGTVQSAGLDREYVLYVPESYDEESSWPLVMVFHGYTMTAAEQLFASGLDQFGGEEGFISVFPEGRGDIQRWLFELDAVEIDISTANPDIALVGDLIDTLSQDLNIDVARVYAAGFSNGGWMASAVACTLPERFAAVSPVAGIMDFGEQCNPTGAVPMITFHGTADQYEPFDGGVENAPYRGSLPTDLGGTYDELPMIENPIHESSVPDKTTLWARRNGCTAEPEATPIDDSVTRWQYDCPESAAVALYEAENGRHWWDLEMAFDTNTHMWEFFTSQTP